MKVGIVYYSETNHTLDVMMQIKEMFENNDYLVDLLPILATKNRLKLMKAPNIDAYEVVIFGSPVHGFALSYPMKEYLKQVSNLKDKKIGLVVTQYFRWLILGGSQAMRYMVTSIEDKNGVAYAGGVIHWSRKDRVQQVNLLVESMKL